MASFMLFNWFIVPWSFISVQCFSNVGFPITKFLDGFPYQAPSLANVQVHHPPESTNLVECGFTQVFFN